MELAEIVGFQANELEFPHSLASNVPDFYLSKQHLNPNQAPMS